MKTIWLFIVVFVGLVIHTRAQTHPANKWKKEEEIAADKVAGLPEVIAADQRCRKLSGGKRHLVSFIVSDPSPGNNYFTVKVGEDNGFAYHTWMLFNVVPKTYHIFYYDVVKAENISLKKWRKHRNKYD